MKLRFKVDLNELKNRHIKMDRRVANFLVTSRQLVGRVGHVEFGERHRRTNQQQTTGLPNLPTAGSMS